MFSARLCLYIIVFLMTASFEHHIAAGDAEKRHFVLVHGRCHGAWCWYKVANQLRSSGHKVTALDMAASGIDPKGIRKIHTLLDYYQPLIDFMESLAQDERVILVGHSFGGVGITLAMERFPEKIYVAVFASATMPGPNLTLSSIRAKFSLDNMDSQFMHDQGPNNPPTSVLYGPNSMATQFYQLSPPEDLVLAKFLVRFGLLSREEVLVTKENYESVRRVFIMLDQDLVVKESVQRWMIENNPTDEVKLISGSDHMVMFSKPQELSSHLQDIANTYS